MIRLIRKSLELATWDNVYFKFSREDKIVARMVIDNAIWFNINPSVPNVLRRVLYDEAD